MNGVAGGNIFDPLTGQPFPGNRIPAANSSPNCGRTFSCIDPISAAYAQYMVQPNVDARRAGNNFIASPNSRADVYNSHLVRVDHNFGDVRFFSRYGHNGRHEDRSNNGRQDIAVTGDGHHYRWNDNLNGDLTWSIGPSMVSNLKVGWTRHERRDLNITDEFDSSTLGYARFVPRADAADELPAADQHHRLRRRQRRQRRQRLPHRTITCISVSRDADQALGPASAQGRRRVRLQPLRCRG